MKKNIVRKYELDVLRFLSCIGVIGIHAMRNTGTLGNLFQSIFRVSLPMFFFISGALNLNKKIDEPIDYYKKRLLRILIPYFFISIIYLSVGFIRANTFDFRSFIRILELPYGVNVHLWYVFSIIGLYLSTPFLGVMCNNLNDKQKKILFYLLLIVVFITKTLPIIHLELGLSSFVFIDWCVYYLIGYLVVDSGVCDNNKIIFYILGIISFVLCFLYGANDAYNLYDFQITMIFEVIMFYYFIKYLCSKFRGENNIIKLICNYSYEVYLIHGLFVNEIVLFSENKFKISSLSWGFCTIIITFILSFISAFIIKNIIDIVCKKLKI